MLRILFAIVTVVPFCCAQSFPAFRWASEVDGSRMDQFAGLGTDAAGNVYIAGSTLSPNFPVQSAAQAHLASPGLNDVFVTKLDPSGNILYSTYFGGSGDDTAVAMTVDPAGNVYVTGNTGSSDFPTTSGAFSPTSTAKGLPANFVFKLNPDGSVGYSTYFAGSQQIQTIAADGFGSAYISGTTYGNLPVTPGAWQTSFCCTPTLFEFPIALQPDAFLTKFDAAGSRLLYSTYLGVPGAAGHSLAVASDGSVYVGTANSGIYRIDATGSLLLGSVGDVVDVQAMAIAADGNVYLAGFPEGFQPTTGAFQTETNPLPGLPSSSVPHAWDAIAKMDPLLQHILAGTYFYGVNGNTVKSMALDAAGNVYIGGYTSAGLPTRTPMVEGFGSGFVSELSGDLSSLLFSGYFGADYNFGVQGVAAGANGSIVIGGPEAFPTLGNIWVNSLALAPPPALRIDSVVNAASLIDGPVSGGETILVRGAGFGNDARLLMGGAVAPGSMVTPTTITATVPAGISNGAAEVVVQSGGLATNSVLVPVATTSPGVFSANGDGYGEGYILIQDGTVNTPGNPAAPGDRITIYATGVGPLALTDGYAVTEFPAEVFIDTIYCKGVAAYLGPVAGLAGNVY